MRRWLVLVVLSLSVCGCASTPRPRDDAPKEEKPDPLASPPNGLGSPFGP